MTRTALHLEITRDSNALHSCVVNLLLGRMAMHGPSRGSLVIPCNALVIHWNLHRLKLSSQADLGHACTMHHNLIRCLFRCLQLYILFVGRAVCRPPSRLPSWSASAPGGLTKREKQPSESTPHHCFKNGWLKNTGNRNAWGNSFIKVDDKSAWLTNFQRSLQPKTTAKQQHSMSVSLIIQNGTKHQILVKPRVEFLSGQDEHL